MYLLVYSDANDPITESLQKNAASLGQELIALSTETILNDVEIFDSIDNGIANLEWTLPDGRKITNDPSIYLINRVLSVEPELFKNFVPEDQAYAQSEFHAYLSFALESFPRKSASPSFLGMAGPTAPLPYQWQRVRDTFAGLQTPRYFMGPRYAVPFDQSSGRLVETQIFNFRNWKPTAPVATNGTAGSQEPVFVFERPLGNPCLVYVAGLQVIGGTLDSLTVAVAEQLRTLAIAIAQTFELRFAELLFFVNDEQLTFGLIHTVPSPTSQAHPDFSMATSNALEGLSHAAAH